MSWTNVLRYLIGRLLNRGQTFGATGRLMSAMMVDGQQPETIVAIYLPT